MRTLLYASLVLGSCILAITLGWDKAMVLLGVIPAEEQAEAVVAPGNLLDLSSRPNILFQVFGTKEDPRMVPIAVLDSGAIRHIQLDSAGWREFDEMFLRKGREYTLYADGRAFGAARLTRGMWDRAEPVYQLAGCSMHTPLAEVAIVSERPYRKFVIEMLASNATLTQPARPTTDADRNAIPSVDRVLPAGDERAFVTGGVLNALDLRAMKLATGATPWPTMITSWLDSASSAANDPTAPTRHIFLIADRGPTGEYGVTYRHQTDAALGVAEFRRFIDHLDLTGDGVDELVLEGWKFGGKTWLLVLQYRDGKWNEIFRSRADWCLDPRPQRRIASRADALADDADGEAVADR